MHSIHMRINIKYITLEIYFYFMHVGIWSAVRTYVPHVCLLPTEARKDTGFPGTGSSHDGARNQTSVFWKSSHYFLISESPLQHQII